MTKREARRRPGSWTALATNIALITAFRKFAARKYPLFEGPWGMMVTFMTMRYQEELDEYGEEFVTWFKGETRNKEAGHV